MGDGCFDWVWSLWLDHILALSFCVSFFHVFGDKG